MQTGTPIGPAASQPGTDTTTARPATTASAGSTGSAGPLAAAAYTVHESAGYWHDYYTDPAGIEVAGAYEYTHWRWNGGCVTESAPGGNYSVNHIYNTSGWYVAGTNTFFKTDCYQNLTQMTSYDENDIFCGGHSTYANFVNDFVSGHYNGSLNGADQNGGLGGGCTGLLSYHSILRYTQ